MTPITSLMVLIIIKIIIVASLHRYATNIVITGMRFINTDARDAESKTTARLQKMSALDDGKIPKYNNPTIWYVSNEGIPMTSHSIMTIGIRIRLDITVIAKIAPIEGNKCIYFLTIIE